MPTAASLVTTSQWACVLHTRSEASSLSPCDCTRRLTPVITDAPEASRENFLPMASNLAERRLVSDLDSPGVSILAVSSASVAMATSPCRSRSCSNKRRTLKCMPTTRSRNSTRLSTRKRSLARMAKASRPLTGGPCWRKRSRSTAWSAGTADRAPSIGGLSSEAAASTTSAETA